MKIKHEMDRKNHFYFGCFDSGFKRFETIKEKELSDLLKV